MLYSPRSLLRWTSHARKWPIKLNGIEFHLRSLQLNASNQLPVSRRLAGNVGTLLLCVIFQPLTVLVDAHSVVFGIGDSRMSHANALSIPEVGFT